MRFVPTEISIMPAERYASAAGSRWPMGIMPAPGELLSSWLHRLAYANGVPPRYFGALLGAPGENWSARLDRALPDRILRLLGEHTHIPLEDIAAPLLPTLWPCCVCPCGQGLSRPAHPGGRLPGCSSVPLVWRKTKRPIFAEAGAWRHAFLAFVTVVGFETGARPADKDWLRSARSVLCRIRSAPGAARPSANAPVLPPMGFGVLSA
jgi:hypothetical protein